MIQFKESHRRAIQIAIKALRTCIRKNLKGLAKAGRNGLRKLVEASTEKGSFPLVKKVKTSKGIFFFVVMNKGRALFCRRGEIKGLRKDTKGLFEQIFGIEKGEEVDYKYFRHVFIRGKVWNYS